MPIRVGFFLPHLDAGGIERVVVNVLRGLPPERFTPVLILRKRRGALLAQVPAHVEMADLGGVPMRHAPLALARALRARRLQVLYTGTNAANLAALVAGRLMRSPPPMVVSEHTPPSLYLVEAKWPRVRLTAMRRLYRRAACVGVPVLYVGEELRQTLGLPALRVEELRNPVYDRAAVDAAMRAPAPAWPAGEGPVFVGAGRLVPAKGFDILVRAFAMVHDAVPRARLLLLGDGPERPALEALVRDLGVAETVHLPGVVENPFAYFARATAMLMTSRREGFGNVLIEAMACGAPVVAADCPFGPRLIVEDGAAGLLVPPEDPAAVAEAMRRVLDRPEEIAPLRARGRERAAEFEAGCTVPRFAALFEELAAP